MNKKKAIIVGAGPSGLTAAFELLKQSKDYEVIILEESADIGGISKTIVYNGHRMDIGGHRFFSKEERVMQWWKDLMPIQGAQSKDDLLLDRHPGLEQGGPDPEKDDRVMLIRQRVSRILYLHKFFDYPISLKASTFINMGFVRTMKGGFGYLKSMIFKRKEDSLENFMINRFGVPLYSMFFRDYTQKVWGQEPKNISASWGAQRVKELSLLKTIKNAILAPFRKKSKDIDQKNTETSLIEQFMYPKLGPGQLWEICAQDIIKMGGQIKMGAGVVQVQNKDDNITSVSYIQDGKTYTEDGDVFISTMPIKDLFNFFDTPAPEQIQNIAVNLPYRDFITVGFLVDKLQIQNKTKLKTVGNIVPDTWIYIQEPDVTVGRLQIFNNWSPYLVADLENTVWVGMEYFCDEGDELWNKSDADFIAFAADELEKMGIATKSSIKDSVRARIKKAYPAYFGVYEQFDQVKDYLNRYKNLYCIGRNGQHRYNNMDHSMLTAFLAVDSILNNGKDKEKIWSVNTDESYHETKK